MLRVFKIGSSYVWFCSCLVLRLLQRCYTVPWEIDFSLSFFRHTSVPSSEIWTKLWAPGNPADVSVGSGEKFQQENKNNACFEQSPPSQDPKISKKVKTRWFIMFLPSDVSKVIVLIMFTIKNLVKHSHESFSVLKMPV